ncbi:hypothetical protein D9757_000959 [Collybiopsis confluens]|uniref:Uncharacterized protein n=1 Tax=Collybiopsis confluens TaxID=2823264 RepID=A0A8H5I026_9AGAR|nr:hypothetical protein D9757_000959 [Collybiopsis confluens]
MTRFQAMEQMMRERFAAIEDRIGGVEGEIAEIKNKITGVEGQITQMNEAFQLSELRQRCDVENTRFRAVNLRRDSVDRVFTHRMKKTVPGQGTDLANDRLPNNCQPLVPLPNTPDLGTVPTLNLNAQPSHDQILMLIQFYNESFDIRDDDGIF